MSDISQVPRASRRVAGLLSDGMSAKELRNRRLARPYHGVRRSNTVDLDQPALRIADAIAVMTEGCSLAGWAARWLQGQRSEEHTSELQSRGHLVCRLLL